MTIVDRWRGTDHILWEGSRVILVDAWDDKTGSITDYVSLNASDWLKLCPGYRDGWGSPMTVEEWREIALGLAALGVRQVAGQVASGSSIAFALQVLSEGKLTARVLGKDGYQPAKHYQQSIYGPYAIVDDIVSSGEAMLWSEKKALEGSNDGPLFCLAFSWTQPCNVLRGRAITALGKRRD